MISTNSSALLGSFLTHSEKPRCSCARRPFGHLPVGDVPHEDVLERVLLVVGDCRLPQMRDEVATLELRKAGARILRRRRFRRPEMCDRPSPEDRTYHRRVVSKLLLLRLQAVEARADQALDARGDRDVAHLVALPAFELEQPLVAQHLHCLLEEERVAAGVGDQRLGERRLGKRGVAGEIGQEGGGSLRIRACEGRSCGAVPPCRGSPGLRRRAPGGPSR